MGDDLKVKISIDKLIEYAIDEQRDLIKKHYFKNMGAATSDLCDSAPYPAILNLIQKILSEGTTETSKVESKE